MFWTSHNDIEKTREWIAFELGQIEKQYWYRFAIVLKDINTLIGTALVYYEEEVLVYEIMEKPLSSDATDICYDGRFFVPKINTDNGEVGGRTLFEYHQKGTVLWADYSGGDVLKGHLIGCVATNGELDFYYHHINTQKQLKVGKCHSVPKILDGGKLELAEKWQWLNGDKSEEESVVVER